MTARMELLGSSPTDPVKAGALDSFGLYAWWGSSSIRWPEGFPAVDASIPLYVGIAATETLAERFQKHHLNRTRGSALRRSLASLLADDLSLQEHLVKGAPRRADKFGLSASGEELLTQWMLEHLLVAAVPLESPGAEEKRLIAELLPPLNDTHATGSPYRVPMRALRKQFGAGE